MKRGFLNLNLISYRQKKEPTGQGMGHEVTGKEWDMRQLKRIIIPIIDLHVKIYTLNILIHIFFCHQMK